MTKNLATVAAVLIATSLPALAETPVDGPSGTAVDPMILTRDSDGMVISVLYDYDFTPLPGSDVGITSGEPFYTFDPIESGAGGGTGTLAQGGADTAGQPVLLGGAELLTAGADGAVLNIGGVSYQVEAKGKRVWLRDLATGARYATARHIAPKAPDAQGLSVNPKQFKLN